MCFLHIARDEVIFSLPFLQYLSKKVGIDNPQNFGYLLTVFALGQLIGSPLFGRLGDLYGSRLALCSAFASSALSYALLVVADAAWVLYASRLVSLLMHVVQGKRFRFSLWRAILGIAKFLCVSV